MRYNSTYNLHSTKQLIDINQSVKNFKAKIHVRSQNQDDKFYVLVVTGDELDNELDNNYKEVKHEVTINLENDDGQPNSDYVLIMKSPNLIKVNVAIDLIDLDNPGQHSGDDHTVEPFHAQGTEPKKSYLSGITKFLTKRNIMILTVLVIGVLIYFFVIKKKSRSSVKLQFEKNEECGGSGVSGGPEPSINIDDDCDNNVESHSRREENCGVLERLQKLTVEC